MIKEVEDRIPDEETPILLEANDLFVGYKQSSPILKNINLTVKPSSMVALLGANGSGKTTLVRTLSGLLPPLQGKILSSSHLTLSWVPQMKNLKLEFPMTLRDSLALSQSVNYWWRKKWIPSESEEEVLEITGVKNFWGLLLRECSGGQLQRFLIARSLLSQASLVFLDEPLDALDRKSQTQIIGLLKDWQLTHNTSFILITHNLIDEWNEYFTHTWKIKGQILES